MNAKNSRVQRSFTSDLERVDARPVAEGDYDELPELNEAMLARAVLCQGGRSARRLDIDVRFNVRLPTGV